MKTNKLAIATNNKHKLTEIKAILGDKFAEILSLGDLGIDIDIEETGTTFEENALIKARTIVALTGLPALADDSGLMVDCLDGQPGVYSARYSGESATDAENNALLLQNMADATNRNAHFVSTIALCYPDGTELISTGTVDGTILAHGIGDSGFGYDPLFFSTELGKTFAQATANEKNSISHRGRALAGMLKLIK